MEVLKSNLCDYNDAYILVKSEMNIKLNKAQLSRIIQSRGFL